MQEPVTNSLLENPAGARLFKTDHKYNLMLNDIARCFQTDTVISQDQDPGEWAAAAVSKPIVLQ